MRPSQLLRGDLWDYQIDVILGVEAMRDAKKDLEGFMKANKGLGAGIAAAAHVAFKAVP